MHNIKIIFLFLYFIRRKFTLLELKNGKLLYEVFKNPIFEIMRKKQETDGLFKIAKGENFTQIYDEDSVVLHKGNLNFDSAEGTLYLSCKLFESSIEWKNTLEQFYYNILDLEASGVSNLRPLLMIRVLNLKCKNDFQGYSDFFKNYGQFELKIKEKFILDNISIHLFMKDYSTVEENDLLSLSKSLTSKSTKNKIQTISNSNLTSSNNTYTEYSQADFINMANKSSSTISEKITSTNDIFVGLNSNNLNNPININIIANKG